MNARSGRLVGTLVLVLGTVALSAGCVVHAQASGGADAAPVVFTDPPTLVAIDGSVWVVRDADYPVYYVDDDYWVIRDGAWYRSHTYDGGWAVVEAKVVPTTIVGRNHTMYVHFHGSVDAKFRPAPRPGETSAAMHEEKPGVGNERKAEGEQPGHDPHTEHGDHHDRADSADHADHSDHGEHHEHGDGPAKDQASAPGVGNERKSDGAQPGQVGKGGPPGSPPGKAGDKKREKKDDKK